MFIKTLTFPYCKLLGTSSHISPIPLIYEVVLTMAGAVRTQNGVSKCAKTTNIALLGKSE